MKKFFIIIAIILVLVAAYIIGTGFLNNESVFIEEFTVSDDGSEMTIKAGVASSVGYIRSVSSHTEGNTICLDFKNAFGGINGSIGAKNEYSLKLDCDATGISVYRGNNVYVQVLEKDENGIWQRVY